MLPRGLAWFVSSLCSKPSAAAAAAAAVAPVRTLSSGVRSSIMGSIPARADESKRNSQFANDSGEDPKEAEEKYRLLMKIIFPPEHLKPPRKISPELAEKRMVIKIAAKRFRLALYKDKLRAESKFYTSGIAARQRFKLSFPEESKWADDRMLENKIGFPRGRPIVYDTPPWDYSDEAPYK